MAKKTDITLRILLALHEHKRIEGTDKLAEIINSKPCYIVPNALILHKMGLIKMTICPNGGRGHKSTYEDAGVITATNNARARS
jgi:hypothetical protein